MTKFHRVTMTSTHSDPAAAQTGSLEADISTGVVLQGASGGDGASAAPRGISDVQTTGPIEIKDHTYYHISGIFHNNTSITLEGYHYGAHLIIDGSATLTGGGQVIMQTNLHPNNFIYGGTLTNLNNTIAGAGDIGNSGTSGTLPLTLINGAKGVIDGYSGPDNGESGTYLLVSPNGGLTNDGLIESTGTTTGLIIRGTTVDGSGGGVILATDGSTLQIDATIAGGTLSSAGSGVVDMYSGELDGRASAVHNTTNLMLNGNPGIAIVGAVANTGTITVDSNVGLFSSITVGTGGATLTGKGQINVTGGASLQSAAVGDVLTNFDNTITGTGVVGGVGGGGSISLVNDAKGVIDGQSGLRLGAGAGTIVNKGLIEATGTLGLTLSTGVIDGSGGGTILANDGATVVLAGADIVGGTFSTTGSGVIRANSGALDGTKTAVHNTGALNIDAHYSLGLQGTLNNTGTVGVLGGGFYDANLIVGAAGATLTGGGQVYLGSRGIIQGAAVGDTLTNNDNTISGAGVLGAGTSGSLTLINATKGVIDGDAGIALRVDFGMGTLTNHGLIEGTSAAGVSLLSGVIDNSSGGVILAGYGGVVALSGAVVAGGTLSTAGSGVIQAQGGTLDGTTADVHLTGDLNIADRNGLTIEGVIANTGSIVLGGFGYGAVLGVGAGGATLTGGGQVVIGGTRSYILSAAAGDVLTNYDNTISGFGSLGSRGSSALTLVNGAKGVIDGNAGIALNLNPGAQSLVNDGLIEATSKAGVVFQSGVVDSSGGGVILAADGGVVTLGSGHVAGGTLSTAGSGYILSVNGYLDGTNGAVHNTGALNVANHAGLAIKGTIDNTGVILVEGGGFYNSNLSVEGEGVTLAGGGQVILGGGRSNIYAAPRATFTNDGNTISGDGNFFYGPITVVNLAGTIESNGASTLTLPTTGGTFTNGGVLEATGAGGLNIQNATVNQSTGGTIFAGSGSAVRLTSVHDIGGSFNTAGTGAIVLADSGSVLDGSTSAVSNLSALQIGNGATLTALGMIDNSGMLSLTSSGTSTELLFSKSATLTGGGTIALSANSMNYVAASKAAVVLTNVDNTIIGSGQLGAGKLTLTNDAAGVIDANSAITLIINTGSTTLTNAGLIETTNGKAVIKSAVANTGTLEVDGGALTLDGAVTGSGLVAIAAGTLDIANTNAAETVSFTGKTGTLELAHSQSFTGAVSGFAANGRMTLDLRDIGFVGAGEATYSGGVLTVSDGSHTAHIALNGSYAGDTFTAASDGHGGVDVVATKTAGMSAPASSIHPLVAAMASLGSSAGGTSCAIPTFDRATAVLLAPRVQAA